MECVNGHKHSGNWVGCGSCKEKGIDFDDRLLYWVDVDEHYGICKHCNVVRKISENIECGICGGRSLCRVKFIDGYKYHNSKAQIAFTKNASDRLCFEYGLSIINGFITILSIS